MASVFTMIIEGDLPSHRVWEDDVCVAFLSINPLTDGHALVVPRAEVSHFDQLEPDVWAHCSRVAQQIALAQKAVFGPERIGLCVAGFEVPHTHLHVWPTDSIADFDWSRAVQEVDHDALAAQAASLREVLLAHGHDEAALTTAD